MATSPGYGNPTLNRILLLQGLRAAAALSVTVHHMLHEPYGSIAIAWLSNLPWQSGVDVFFVISGFVIVHSSARLFGAAGASRVFLWRRLARIVPLYWVVTMAFLVVDVMFPHGLNSPSPGLLQILASYAFIPWPAENGLIQPVYSLGWTLNYEMMFYAVFALFLQLSRVRAVVAAAVVLGSAVIAGWVLRPQQPALIFLVQSHRPGVRPRHGSRTPGLARGEPVGSLALGADFSWIGAAGVDAH
jgi:exopolysaccharide production protein ExoZ